MIRAKLVSLVWLGIALGLCTAQTPRVSQQTIPPDMLITLERPGCFLFCPEYTLTISADGLVTYEGKARVRVIGKAQTQISREKVQVLVAALLRARFFSLRDRYASKRDGCRQIFVDSEPAITSIVMNGRSKSVYHYLGCVQKSGITYPKVLTELEEKIDEVANAKQWIE
jgi:hypothetical protein